MREEEKEMARQKVWEPTVVGVDSVDWQGNEITLENVPAERLGKEVRVRLDDIMKAEQQYLASKYKLNPRNIHELLLLYAAPRFIKGGYIEQKFRFNKMLFHEWKELERLGYGDSYIFDEFGSARAGPVPITLRNDLVELDKKGIIKARWERQPGKSCRFELTKQGEKVAKSIWDNTPTDIKAMVLKTKEELFLIDAEQLKHHFHKRYPEYKKDYIELDAE